MNEYSNSVCFDLSENYFTFNICRVVFEKFNFKVYLRYGKVREQI